MKNLSDYQLLILTAVVATLANGVWFLPALSWIYPVFLMLFARRNGGLKSALFGVPILIMASVAQYLAMDFPVPQPSASDLGSGPASSPTSPS